MRHVIRVSTPCHRSGILGRVDQNLRNCSAGILVPRTLITSDFGLTLAILVRSGCVLTCRNIDQIYGTSLIACARWSLTLVKLVPSLSLALAPSHDQVLSLPLVLAPLHEPRQGLGRVAERVMLYRSAQRRLIFLWSCRNLASPSSGRSMVSHGFCVYRLQE